ncbi:MAG: helix-turn-helix domain-containing protein [Gammaproteobacteria bacterium]
MSKNYLIGQVAKAARCKVQTVRYYERVGLLPEAARTEGNQRVYGQAHLDRLSFIRHSRELGFSLEQIRKILDLVDDPTQSCIEVDRIAKLHLKEVESKIRRLEGMRMELQRMISQCAGGHVTSCRIVESLADHSRCIADDHLIAPTLGQNDESSEG